MIEFKHSSISLSRDGRRNLAVNLSLSKGELAVVLGPNGSGKTTLMDVIAGIERLDVGRMLVEPSNSPVAYAVQDAASGLLPWRTILSNILLPTQLHNGLPEKTPEKALMLLGSFGLDDRKNDFPYKLSEGEKQIVNLIRTVCTPASILLLDEPFASLNVKARVKAKEMLLEFAAGRTTLLVTHDPADLDWPISRFFRIRDSSVIEIGLSEAKEVLEDAVQKTSV
jgi:taurine transport system ATP-binding protein